MAYDLSNKFVIMQHRTAFAIFLKSGIEEVKRLYPSSLDFVLNNSEKSLKEVTNLLTEKLNDQSEERIHGKGFGW